MSESEGGILVDFNANDTFSKIKSAVEAEPIEAEPVEPKPKRKPSTKKIIVEPVEDEPVEDIKPKPKRKPSTKKIIEAEPVEDIEDIKPKPKPKRKPSKIIVEDLKPEPVVIVEEAPKKNIKTLEQIDCPKCEKPMTKTTLRYHHDKTCPGEKVNREDIPVKKRAIKEKVVEIPKVEKSTYKDRLNEQIKIKKEHIKKLATQIA